MTARGRPSGEPRNTLLLYCPYDRRVTRHARKGSDQALACLECGRRIEDTQRGPTRSTHDRHADSAAAPAGGAAAGASRRPRVVATRRGHFPLYALGVIAAGGVLAVASVLASVASTGVGPDRETPVSGPTAEGPALVGIANTDGLVRIANTDGQGAYLRRTPNLEDRLRPWPDSTILKVIGPDTSADGLVWKQVEDPTGNRGWVPAQFTIPEPSE